MIAVLIRIIQIISQVLFILVVAEVLLSYFMSPYHPLRAAVTRITEPLLAPIRRVIKPVGSLDFSPLVLIIIIQIIEVLLVSLISGFR